MAVMWFTQWDIHILTEYLLQSVRSMVQSTLAILTSVRPGNSFLERSSHVGARFLQWPHLESRIIKQLHHLNGQKYFGELKSRVWPNLRFRLLTFDSNSFQAFKESYITEFRATHQVLLLLCVIMVSYRYFNFHKTWSKSTQITHEADWLWASDCLVLELK